MEWQNDNDNNKDLWQADDDVADSDGAPDIEVNVNEDRQTMISSRNNYNDDYDDALQLVSMAEFDGAMDDNELLLLAKRLEIIVDDKPLKFKLSHILHLCVVARVHYCSAGFFLRISKKY